jgi:hypothetical protein
MQGPEVLQKLRMDDRWKKIPIVPFSSIWDERLDEPFQKDLQFVKKWQEANRFNEKTSGGYIGPMNPKYQGMEDTTLVPPRLIISVARILIQQEYELTPSFELLLHLSERHLQEADNR